MIKRIILLLIVSLSIGFLPVEAQKKKKKDQAEESPEPKEKPAIKKYADVITDKTETDVGLFTFHKVDDNYYFELPQSILEKEILIVSRISGHVKGLNFGGAGMKSRPQQVIRFQRKDNNIIIRSVSYNAVADADLPIYQSVKNNNFEPIIYSFEIEALGKDSASYVIDIKDFFTTDVPMIGALRDTEREEYKVRCGKITVHDQLD